MRIKTPSLTLVLLSCIACSEETPPISESQPSDEPPVVVESAGAASFVLDGEPRKFEHQDRDNSIYYKLSSAVEFQPQAGASETLMIRFAQVDLKIIEYPIDLPLPRDLTNPTSLTGTMATIGFGYVDSDGNEWAGPGTVRLESFDEDGNLIGSFDGVQIPHTDNTLAPITLSNGQFKAGL